MFFVGWGGVGEGVGGLNEAVVLVHTCANMKNVKVV